MPARKDFTPEFKDQAVRFVLEEIRPGQVAKAGSCSYGAKLSVKAMTRCNRAKRSLPTKACPMSPPGSLEELRALNAALRTRTGAPEN